MEKYSDLFVLQLVNEHYNEFNIDNFIVAVNNYFINAKNKDEIKEIIIKYLYQVKFTKEELEQLLRIKMSRMSEEELQMNKEEWEKYTINEKGKAI